MTRGEERKKKEKEGKKGKKKGKRGLRGSRKRSCQRRKRCSGGIKGKF
jgi:hypothetical protein